MENQKTWKKTKRHVTSLPPSHGTELKERKEMRIKTERNIINIFEPPTPTITNFWLLHCLLACSRYPPHLHRQSLVKKPTVSPRLHALSTACMHIARDDSLPARVSNRNGCHIDAGSHVLSCCTNILSTCPQTDCVSN